MNFKEGKHLANHLSNSSRDFTSKIATIKVLENLKICLEKGQIQSKVFNNLR
jgi:hypothetical protein